MTVVSVVRELARHEQLFHSGFQNVLISLQTFFCFFFYYTLRVRLLLK